MPGPPVGRGGRRQIWSAFGRPGPPLTRAIRGGRRRGPKPPDPPLGQGSNRGHSPWTLPSFKGAVRPAEGRQSAQSCRHSPNPQDRGRQSIYSHRPQGPTALREGASYPKTPMAEAGGWPSNPCEKGQAPPSRKGQDTPRHTISSRVAERVHKSPPGPRQSPRRSRVSRLPSWVLRSHLTNIRSTEARKTYL